ncbi:hypothetical protein Emag_000751 [Eimeria magna]
MGSGGLEGVPREVIQWLHDRGVQLAGRSIKRQMANGVLAARILETTFPNEVQALMLDQGLSLQVRRHNWSHLLQLCRKLHIELSPSKVELCAYESHASSKPFDFHGLRLQNPEAAFACDCEEACVGVLSDLYAALTARSPESLKINSTRPSAPAYTAPTAAQLLKNGLLYLSLDETETSNKTQAIIHECLKAFDRDRAQPLPPVKRKASHKERQLRVYEQWLPEGATESLFLPTRQRASPPPPSHAAPASMQFAAAFSGTAKAGHRPQTQQQATLTPALARVEALGSGLLPLEESPRQRVPLAKTLIKETLVQVRSSQQQQQQQQQQQLGCKGGGPLGSGVLQVQGEATAADQALQELRARRRQEDQGRPSVLSASSQPVAAAAAPALLVAAAAAASLLLESLCQAAAAAVAAAAGAAAAAAAGIQLSLGLNVDGLSRLIASCLLFLVASSVPTRLNQPG